MQHVLGTEGAERLLHRCHLGLHRCKTGLHMVQETLGRPLRHRSKRPFAPSPNHFRRLSYFRPLSQALWFARLRVVLVVLFLSKEGPCKMQKVSIPRLSCSAYHALFFGGSYAPSHCTPPLKNITHIESVWRNQYSAHCITLMQSIARPEMKLGTPEFCV